MNINVRDIETAKIVEVSGDINGKNALQLQEEMSPLLKDNTTRLILDLERVEFMASAGLRILLSIRRQIPVSENFVLVNLNEHLLETLNITGFIDFFTYYDSLEQALVLTN